MSESVWRDYYTGSAIHYITSSSGKCHPGMIIDNYTVVDGSGYPNRADIWQLDVLGVGGLPLQRNAVAWGEHGDVADTWHERAGCPRNEPI